MSGLEWTDLLYLLAILQVIAFFWAVNHAFDHTDYGLVWVSIFILTGSLGVWVYLAMALYANRPYRGDSFKELLESKQGQAMSRFGSEIERARFIEAASSGPGTMYDPVEGVGERAEGHQHFVDARAEELLGSGRTEEAWQYLLDLHQLAAQEGDPQRRDTYRAYIARLPGGTERLRAWEGEALRESAAPAAPQNRSAPF